MASEGWHRPEVNRHVVWKNYVDQFEGGHAAGLLQEAGQNSFDAYPPGTPQKGMKIAIKYDAGERVLKWRDFDTRGMPHCNDCKWGELSDGKPCVNGKCPWGAFHNMGYSVKDGGLSLGSRGMGKSLTLLAGARTIVRTMLPNGKFNASEWEKKDDWVWRNAPELVKPLSAPGTEIETTGVVDSVHNDLVNMEYVVAELQERWFRPLEEGAQISYNLVKGGKTLHKDIPKPTWPALDTTHGEAKAKLLLPKVVIKYQGEVLGELQNVHVFLAKKPFDDDDPRWGIAIVKNGKQTITRFREFPGEIPGDIARRIYGWCDAACTDDKPFLKEAENSTHTGYTVNHNTYRAVKRELRSISKKLVEPFLSAGGEKINEKEAAEAKELLSVINDALAEIPELNLFGKGPIVTPPPKTPKDYIYLSRVDFEKKSYTRGEHVKVKAVIKNPTSKEVIVLANFEHYDPTPVVVADFNDGAVMPAGTIEAPSTKEVVWDCVIDPSLAPGIHWIQVTLADVGKAPLLDKEGNPTKMRHALYVEVKPPEIKKPGTGEGGSKGFSNYQWFKRPDLADSFEAYIDLSQMAAFVNRRGRRLEYFVSSAKSKRAHWPVVAELVGEKIVEQVLERELSVKDTWKSEEVRKVVLQLEAGKATFVRQMVKIVAKLEGKDKKTAGSADAEE